MKITINGMFVQNYFLHGLEIEKEMKLKIYMKLEKTNMILVYGVPKL